MKTILLLLTLITCSAKHLSAAQEGLFIYQLINDDSAIKITGISNPYYTGPVNIPASIVGKPVISIGSSAFHSLDRLPVITIPNSITTIEGNAFHGCSKLDTITIPNSVTTIGAHAFENCTGLTSITIPNSVTSIENSVFESCSGLTSITIPEGITNIGFDTFQGCSSLTSITIPDSVTSIERNAFRDCSKLSAITIPDSVTSIGNYAFTGCDRLSAITIPHNVTSIGIYVFSGCKLLSSVTLPEGLTSISPRMFHSCTSLRTIILPDSITTIEAHAFHGCSKLSSITIPDGVTVINDYAFGYCSQLTDAFFLGNAPENEGTNVFYQASSEFSVTYLSGSAGFWSPSWRGYPSAAISAIGFHTELWLLENNLPDGIDLSQDLNGDGVSLLMAYALNLNPHKNLNSSLPVVEIANDQLSMNFYGNSKGVHYTIKTSQDLRNWTDNGVIISDSDSSGFRKASINQEGTSGFLKLEIIAN